MKSLALNFIALLLLFVSALAARTAVTVKPSPTTTTQRPSLRAPQPAQATTPAIILAAKIKSRTNVRGSTTTTTSSLSAANVVTTKSPATSTPKAAPTAAAASPSSPSPSTATITTTTTTETIRQRRQRAQIARQLSLAHANNINKIERFNATRLVHKSDATTTNTGTINQYNSSMQRQHRSLDIGKTLDAASQQRHGNAAKIGNSNPQLERHRGRLRTKAYNTTATSVANRNTNNNAEMITSEHQLLSGFMDNNSNSNNNNYNNNNNTNNNNNNKRQQSQSNALLPFDNVVGNRLIAHAPHTKAITTTRNASDIVKLPQTLKTPRMIQRLVAGHIQNAQGHSSYEISSVSTNATVTIATTSAPAVSYLYRRRQPLMSSTYNEENIARTKTTNEHKTKSSTTQSTIVESANDIDDRDDDEALLDETGDFDNWDNGILRLSAGSGKENTQKSKKNKEDSKKTLADQVRDGKYGLIEQELFQSKPKRPGILSYLPNKEMPHDNERNFGGLNEEDIWLAEDHLLVIKGGSLNDAERNEPWPPIDDYDAPPRPIKIPAKPKIPPPFPVQLEENGPVQLIGNNKFTVVYPVANETIPIYTTGPETKHTSSESDSDDKKNLITRPGQSEDSKEDGPAYIYPAPYPPWIYHNQTFVNPLLKKARPIEFPALGPFPFARNGSLDNTNNTDELDEDDPSLYYPPAYSFVYKNNYKNAVSPGPLVPGIVLPPPPNQFSLLKPKEKPITSTVYPLVHRQRYTTTTTTTTSTTTTTRAPTTTTTTTTTTTPAPFRHTITRITEYVPKTIIITPTPQEVVTVPPPTYKLPPPPPTPPSTTYAPPIIEPVPVPVAVPVPIYPVNYQPTPRPNIVTFVPTTPEPDKSGLSKSNPIYYEYFEAKRQPTTSNVIDEFLSTTARPPTPSPKPVKLYATSKRPYKGQAYRAGYVQKPNRRPIVDENIVYITPKPVLSLPNYKQLPLDFESEVNAIRDTLRYYKNQQLRDNNIPRAPKSKPIYEYSFDATKNVQPQAVEEQNFQEPDTYEEEPFRPMVTYSPAVDDENAFKAIAYDKVDNEVVSQAQPPSQQQQQQQQHHHQKQHHQSRKYQSTTTLVPVRKEVEFRGRPKKLRLTNKYLQQQQQQQQQQQNTNYQIEQQQQQQPIDYQTTVRTVLTTEAPWISIEKQHPQPQQQQEFYRSERLQMPQDYNEPQNRGFNGYYYQPPPVPQQQQRPPPPSRQNHRYYSEPFQTPQRKIVNYRPVQQHPQQQQQQQQWSLENDTYVNYLPNRPPLNPDAEFITPYQSIPDENYPYNAQRLPPPPPPPQPQQLSHQPQYYAPPPIPLPQYQPQYHQQQQQPLPLHRDILVNYRQPLPPINPDSEYISHPQVVRNQPQQYYRQPAGYRVRPIDGGGIANPQTNLYYVTPKYRRAHNSNNNNNNGNQGSTS